MSVTKLVRNCKTSESVSLARVAVLGLILLLTSMWNEVSCSALCPLVRHTHGGPKFLFLLRIGAVEIATKGPTESLEVSRLRGFTLAGFPLLSSWTCVRHDAWDCVVMECLGCISVRLSGSFLHTLLPSSRHLRVAMRGEALALRLTLNQHL